MIAVVLGEYGTVTPAAMSSSLKSQAKNVVTGVPSGTTYVAQFLPATSPSDIFVLSFPTVVT
jgi:hypothetical protein